ncbi:hypothetical protein OROGR_013156 [Orobanche gracilis]
MGEICGGDQRPRRHVSGSVLSIRLRTLLSPTTPTARSFRGPKAKKNFPLSPIGAGFLISTLETLISNKSAISRALDLVMEYVAFKGCVISTSTQSGSAMAQAPASTPSAAPTVAPASAPPTTAPSASVTPPASSPASTSPSSSPPAPPTPLVGKPAGFTALPPLISVASRCFCSTNSVATAGSAALLVLSAAICRLSRFKVFHSLRRGRSAAMKENNGTFSFGNANKFEERSDYCVIDSFGKSIVLDCFKIQNLLLGLKKCNTKGRYKIRAARFIKGIVTAPTFFAIEELPELRPIIDRGFDNVNNVLMWYAQDNMVHGRILLQRFLKDKLSNM